MTLNELYHHLLKNKIDVTLVGDPNTKILKLATIQNAGEGAIVFLNNVKYRKFLETTTAAAIILNKKDAEKYHGNALICEDSYLAWAYISQIFDPHKFTNYQNIHKTAVIAESAIIHESAIIGPHVVIEENVSIGAYSYIGPHCLIEQGATIGTYCHLHSGITIAYDCLLGNNVIIHPGAVIGAQGFGFAKSQEGYVKVAQVGRVVIGDDVDIGANSCIDRGSIDDTIIKTGAKIDNHVQIGHNCIIGEHTVIAGCTGIAGSATIGNHVIVGGGVGMNGHITIADHVIITGETMVTHSLLAPGIYSSGLPVAENRKWLRNTAQLQQIDKLYDRVKTLEKLLDNQQIK